jgi:hypothetical protein
MQVQCAEFPRIELVCKVHSTGRLRRPLLVGNASAARLRRIPAANSIGTSLRPETRPAHMHIPSADSIRSPRGAYAPPAPGCTVPVRRRKRQPRCAPNFAAKSDIRAAQTHVRPRAAGVSPPWFAEPHLQVERDEFRHLDFACGVHATGGLRPPLLVAQCRFAGENDYRAAHRTSLQKATFALHKRTFTRAAGVSPPWFSEPHLQVERDEFRRLDRACGVHPTERLRPPLVAACATYRVRYAFPIRNGGCVPRGAYAPRSWSGMRALRRIVRIPAASSTGTSLRSGTRPARMRIPSADSIRSPQLAHAIRSWLRMRTLLQMCDSGRRKRCFSTGGLRPPLLLLIRRASAGRMTIFAMNKRTFTRAAGVSPPWLSEPHMQVQCDGFRRFEFVCGVHATGGLRPPLLVARRSFAVKSGICGAQTHVFKSGGCQPAVVFRTGSASAMR